jgi:hypothetical protein
MRQRRRRFTRAERFPLAWWAHNHKTQGSLVTGWRDATGRLRGLFDRLTHRGQRPPRVSVREPRRLRPALPAGAVALEEPRTALKRRIRLNRRHSA